MNIPDSVKSLKMQNWKKKKDKSIFIFLKYYTESTFTVYFAVTITIRVWMYLNNEWCIFVCSLNLRLQLADIRNLAEDSS